METLLQGVELLKNAGIFVYSAFQLNLGKAKGKIVTKTNQSLFFIVTGKGGKNSDQFR